MDGDDFARLRAESDQLLEGMREFAATTAAYYKGLIEQDIPEPQAARLTGEMVVGMLKASREDD
jgi:hypothetical protein